MGTDLPRGECRASAMVAQKPCGSPPRLLHHAPGRQLYLERNLSRLLLGGSFVAGQVTGVAGLLAPWRGSWELCLRPLLNLRLELDVGL
jgi:hypothetical protein